MFAGWREGNMLLVHDLTIAVNGSDGSADAKTDRDYWHGGDLRVSPVPI